MAVVVMDWLRGLPGEDLLVLLSGLIFIGMGIRLLWRIMGCRVRVYVKGGRENYRLAMSGHLFRKKGIYCYVISASKLRRRDYTAVKLVLTRLFAERHKGKRMYVWLEGVKTAVLIGQEIYLK